MGRSCFQFWKDPSYFGADSVMASPKRNIAAVVSKMWCTIKTKTTKSKWKGHLKYFELIEMEARARERS